MIDIVIERLHPVGYFETLPNGDRVGPMNRASNDAAEAKLEVHDDPSCLAISVGVLKSILERSGPESRCSRGRERRTR